MPHLPGLPGEPQKAHPHHKRPPAPQSEEIKRRTRVVRIFPNRESCLRLVTALAVEVSEEWVTGRRYLDMEELREHRRFEERETNGVMLMGR
jgi:putative transposase